MAPRLFWIFVTGIMVLGPIVAHGQSYPNKPVRLLTSAAGSGADAASRIIAQAISTPTALGQPVVVENRTGVIAIETAAKSPPDGYTLLLYGEPLWIAPLMQDKLSYNAERDFSPITLVTASPLLVVVPMSLSINSVKELIAVAKSKPGTLNYGSAAIGSPTHLAPELFNTMAGVNTVRINYKGSGPALTALIGGEVQFMITSAAQANPHVRSGLLKALAVTTAQPTPLFPALPTVASTLPGYEVAVVIGVLAPAGTPAPVIKRLNQEIVHALNQADVKQFFRNDGAEVVGSTPEAFAAKIRSDTVKIGKIVKDLGIHVE